MIGSQHIVFGGTYTGAGEKGFVYCGDLWSLDTTSTPMTWNKPQCIGRGPAPRYGHGCCVMDTRMYVFGGKGEAGQLFNDLWELETTTWAWKLCLTTSAPPSPRLGHSMVAVGGKVVVFGGWDGRVANSELWVYDRATLTWNKPKVTGTPPTARQGHVGVLHVPGGRMLISGGASYHPDTHCPQYLKDTRELDLSTMAWGRPRITGEYPAGRTGGATATLANVMVLFGGWAGPAVPEAPPGTAPPTMVTMQHEPGMGFGAVAPPGSLISVPAGVHTGTNLLDLDEGEWVSPVVAGRPPGYRYGSSAAAAGLKLFMWGGWEDGRPINELLILDLSALSGQ